MIISWIFKKGGVIVNFSDEEIIAKSIVLAEHDFEGFMNRFLGRPFSKEIAETKYSDKKYEYRGLFNALKEKIVVSLIARLDEYILNILKDITIVRDEDLHDPLIIRAKEILAGFYSQDTYDVFLQIKDLLHIDSESNSSKRIKKAIAELLETIKSGNIIKAMKFSAYKVNNYVLPTTIDATLIQQFELDIAVAISNTKQQTPEKCSTKKPKAPTELTLMDIKTKFQGRLQRFMRTRSLGLGDKRGEILLALQQMIQDADLSNINSNLPTEEIRAHLINAIQEEIELSDYGAPISIKFSKNEQYYWGITSQISNAATKAIIEVIEPTGALKHFSERFPNPVLLLDACLEAYDSKEKARVVYNSVISAFSSTYPYMLQRGNANGEYIVTPTALSVLVEGILFVNIQAAQHGEKIKQNIKNLQEILSVLHTIKTELTTRSIRDEGVMTYAHASSKSLPTSRDALAKVQYFEKYIGVHLRLAEMALKLYEAQQNPLWQETYEQEALQRPPLPNVIETGTSSSQIVQEWARAFLLERIHCDTTRNPGEFSFMFPIDPEEREAIQLCTFPTITNYEKYRESIDALQKKTRIINENHSPQKNLPFVRTETMSAEFLLSILYARTEKEKVSWTIAEVTNDIFRACFVPLNKPMKGTFLEGKHPAQYPPEMSSKRSSTPSGIAAINCSWLLADSWRQRQRRVKQNTPLASFGEPGRADRSLTHKS